MNDKNLVMDQPSVSDGPLTVERGEVKLTSRSRWFKPEFFSVLVVFDALLLLVEETA